MKTLANGIDQVEIVDRLTSVNADDVADWGIMKAPEMLCHLRGASWLQWVNFRVLL